MIFLNWIFDFFGWCRIHHIRTEWDGAEQTYVCPLCVRLAMDVDLQAARATGEKGNDGK